MRLTVLGSGSRGNALVVESEHGRLLVDAGFSRRQLARRLESVGLGIVDLDAVVMTHEHTDHCRGADSLARRDGLPLCATAGTLEGLALSEEAARATRRIRSGWPFETAGFSVEPFLVPHDAREPVGLVIEDASGHRVGLAADLGSPSCLAWARLRELDVLVLETNHDLEMLRRGPYPWALKERVAGRHGHLSNRQAVEGLGELVHNRLGWVVLYHLSRTNNLPSLAAAAVGEELERLESRARLVVSDQFEPTAWIEVRA